MFSWFFKLEGSWGVQLFQKWLIKVPGHIPIGIGIGESHAHSWCNGARGCAWEAGGICIIFGTSKIVTKYRPHTPYLLQQKLNV